MSSSILSSRAMSPREQKRDEILDLFNGNMSTVVLVGDAGMGKTWLAEGVRKEAISRHSCYGTIWLSLNRIYDARSLFENVAHQLSLSKLFDECEDDTEEEEEEELEELKKRIAEKLEGMKKRDKYLLLVLDDEGYKTSEKEVMTDLGLKALLTEAHQQLMKVLITRRSGDEGAANEIEENRVKVTLEPLTRDDLEKLLEKNINLDTCSKPHPEKSAILDRSMGLPAAVVVLSKTLTQIYKKDSDLSLEQIRVLEEFAFSTEVSEDTVASVNSVKRCNPVLQLAYDILESEEDSAIRNCFWHSLDVFDSYGCIYYSDLVTHWILEGYFDPVTCLKKAYQEGHDMLMDLMNRGMLKIQEDNVVVAEGSMTDVLDLRRRGHFEKTKLGLIRAFRCDKKRSFGKISQMDEMIKSLTTKIKGDKISTVAVKGHRFRREYARKFVEEMKGLEVLGLFEPFFHSLVPSLSELTKLRVLVIRDCDLVTSIDELSILHALHALEVSGASRLETIHDEFFKSMAQLQDLNFSRLRIEYLPPSISESSELRCLIIRNCPNLKELPDIQCLTNLEVVDVHGATSLKCSSDKSKNKNFVHLRRLQTMDFSDSKLERLPIFQEPKKYKDLSSVTRLLLRNCTKLTRLTHLFPLSRLQVLDLSGAVGLLEIIETAFQKKDELKILDLSSTPIMNLPREIANLVDLRRFLMKGCPNLETLPEIGQLIKLEVLDVSGCSNLTDIEGSFENMYRLQELNLSGTRIKKLPALPERNRIRCLHLKDCSDLETLPDLGGLKSLEVLELPGCEKLEALPKLDSCTKLQVLDLSGCSDLKTIDGSFEGLDSLQKLNLSDTKIECVPALKHSGKLSHLYIRNCSRLEDLPETQFLSNLQELDVGGLDHLSDKLSLILNLSSLEKLNLCGTNLSDLSFFANLTNLNELSLAINGEVSTGEYLRHLTSLTKLEVLSVSGLESAGSLHQVPKIQRLKCIILPDFGITHEVNWTELKGLANELSFEKFGLSVPNEILVLNEKPPLVATGKKAFDLLEAEPDLCSQDLHVSLRLEEQVASTAMSRLGYEDLYFKTRAVSDQQRRFLEMHGSYDSNDFPDHVKPALAKAECVLFVDNSSDGGSSILNEFNINCAKGLWLERCLELKNIFSDEGGKSIPLQVEHLETLWVSNLPKLEKTMICSGDLTPGSFKNLKTLCFDCCPKLTSLFPTPLPLTCLEMLQIKFCDQLEEVFEEEGELPNLQSLILLGLPKLSAVKARLPKLNKFRSKNCPELNDTEESLREGNASGLSSS